MNLLKKLSFQLFVPLLALSLAFAESAEKNIEKNIGKPITIHGTISKINSDLAVLKGDDGTVSEVVLTSSTKFSYGPVDIKLADVKPGQFVMVRGEQDSTGKVVATLVHPLPRGAN